MNKRFKNLESENDEIKGREIEITEIKYRRVFNIGNYQTIAIELAASAQKGDDIQNILKELDKEACKYMRVEKDNFN